VTVRANDLSERVKAWVSQVRTQGFQALWDRMVETEREELAVFGRELDAALELEIEHRWQAAADRYRGIAERFPAYSDIAVARATHVIDEKINRAIRYYNQGIQTVEARQYQKALQYFDLALNVDHNMERALYNLGMTHKLIYISNPAQNTGNKISAIDTFRKLLARNPRHVKAAAQIEQLSKL
jgi:tetratricopeptide (TPR) repeat protein